jgi:formylglycine-generating enzyme required for sulfatase activity
VRSFFLGKFEVTQAQWRAVVELLPQINRELHADPAKFKGDDLPVTHVSWDEAQEFCERLSRKTGRPYRLPSEAEWEYACRAGTTTPFHFGETITTQYANFNGKYPYAEAPEGEYRGRTTPVGSFRVANAFGLYDMHGNVWEWCLDPMRWTYVEAPTDGSAWTTGDVKWSRRVTRGGAYGNDNSPGFESYYCCGGAFFYNFCAFDCRSARRNAMSKMARSHDLGFRLALSLVPQ